MSFSTLKQPSAFIPLAMSFAALSLVLGHVAFFGVAREADEGTAAHLWQLLMAGQLPVMSIIDMVVGAVLSVARIAAVTGLVMALADYAVARRRVGKQLRMSKQDVKDDPFDGGMELRLKCQRRADFKGKLTTNCRYGASGST